MPDSDKAAERHLLVTIQSQPQHRQRVQQLLLKLVDLVRLEPGCLYYHLFQQAEEPDTFLLSAAWAHDEAVAAHPTPPQSRVVEQLQPLLAVPMHVRHTRRLSEHPG
ncbi:putative quinol monooxygenase [Hymenobacter sp. CRA2]|uniref:putative quinol monooxygenase n=1 Tax=Hymenobacter sp. CRA2 TaxID=1955620 RepID=UPI00098FEA69|nr:putative quinol monooxygenase [Hymenobacter sp. CRA2]OON70305.1 hypothetical protein B0919_06120 [Hymenobacter sp. CRA2]